MPLPIPRPVPLAPSEKQRDTALAELVNRTADAASYWVTPSADSKMAASDVILVSSELREESAPPRIVVTFNLPLDENGKKLIAELERIADEQQGSSARHESEGKGTLMVILAVVGTCLAALKILQATLHKAMELCVQEFTVEDDGRKVTWKKLGRPKNILKELEQMRTPKMVAP